MNDPHQTIENTVTDQNYSTQIEKWPEVRREVIAQGEGGVIVRVTGWTQHIPGDPLSDYFNRFTQPDSEVWSNFLCLDVRNSTWQSTDEKSESPSPRTSR